MDISPVFLQNATNGTTENAELWDAIVEKNLADWEAEWVPELFKIVQRLNRLGVSRQHWPQSRHWDWRKKAAALQGFLAYPGFSIVCGGVTQGMMILDVANKRCRINQQKDKPLVYVEYIESAPWNRKEPHLDPPKYRGVGVVLIRAAIEMSKHEEFQGRIGLHSLPQANAFYANTCGMTDLGADEEYLNLRYFEMTSQQAEDYLRKGEHK